MHSLKNTQEPLVPCSRRLPPDAHGLMTFFKKIGAKPGQTRLR
jgi:hypothetical protein